jgi:hypothetical protein
MFGIVEAKRKKRRVHGIDARKRHFDLWGEVAESE